MESLTQSSCPCAGSDNVNSTLSSCKERQAKGPPLILPKWLSEADWRKETYTYTCTCTCTYNPYSTSGKYTPLATPFFRSGNGASAAEDLTRCFPLYHAASYTSHQNLLPNEFPRKVRLRFHCHVGSSPFPSMGYCRACFCLTDHTFQDVHS